MKHLFVVTYGRSGSTALQNLLNAIDGYCIRGENGGALNTIVQAVDIFKTRHAVHAKRSNYGPDDPWYGIELVESEKLQNDLAGVFEENFFHTPEGARATGFKEIRYTPSHMTDEQFHSVMDFLLTRFEDARIIFNTRAAEQVAMSGWWSEQSKRKVIKLIRQSDIRFTEAHRRHPEQTYLIDHAEYHDRPEGFHALLEWLDEELPPETVQQIATKRLTHMQKAPLKSAILGKLLLHRRTVAFTAAATAASLAGLFANDTTAEALLPVLGFAL